MTRPKQFDLIAFDWDGTLFDSTVLITRCIQEAARDLGLAVPSDERASHVIGLGLHDALAHALPSLPAERYQELGLRWRHHFLKGQDDVTLFPGVIGMLQALKARHHWLTVATGKTRRGLDHSLQAVELQGLFDGSRTADETASKPAPNMLFELMREFGTDPERTLMIGDTSHDLQMAANAGCAAVAVSYGAHEIDTLASYRPLHVAHDVNDLQRWLLENA